MLEYTLSRLTKRFRFKADAKKAIRRYGRKCSIFGFVYGLLAYYVVRDSGVISAIMNPQPAQPMPWWGWYFVVGIGSVVGTFWAILGIGYLAMWHQKHYVKRDGEERATETQK